MEKYLEYYQYCAELIKENVYHIHDATKANYPGLHEDGTYNNPSSMYLILDEKKALQIDLGNPYEDFHLREFVNQLIGQRELKVAITHNHFDHIGALKQFLDCEIYVPENDPVEGVIKETKIKEGDIIDLGHYQFEVLDVKGHTEGSLAFYDQKSGLLATGDAFGSSYVWLLFIENVIEVYQKTLEKTIAKLKDNDHLCFLCGHRYQQQIQEVKGIHPLSPKNPEMDLYYLEDMYELTKQILNGTASSHEFFVFNRTDTIAYTYQNAEIDTYLLGHDPITLP